MERVAQRTLGHQVGCVRCCCHTLHIAWSPPIPIWDRLVDLGCKVSAEYEDEGLMFKGIYKDGLDECWEPTALDDERLEPEEEDV